MRDYDTPGLGSRLGNKNRSDPVHCFSEEYEHTLLYFRVVTQSQTLTQKAEESLVTLTYIELVLHCQQLNR